MGPAWPHAAVPGPSPGDDGGPGGRWCWALSLMGLGLALGFLGGGLAAAQRPAAPLSGWQPPRLESVARGGLTLTAPHPPRPSLSRPSAAFAVWRHPHPPAGPPPTPLPHPTPHRLAPTALPLGCLGAGLLLRFAYSAAAARPTVALAAEPGTEASPPCWRRTMARVVCDIGLAVAAYLWFFQSIHLVNALMHHSPALEIPTYLGLALLPAAAFQSRVFYPSVERTCWALRTLTGDFLLRHLLGCTVQPLQWLVQALLAFFASNLLLNAVPEEWTVRLPQHLGFLDRNGDSVLSAGELQAAFQVWSSGLLQCVACTLLGYFLLRAKAMPDGWEEPKQEEAGAAAEPSTLQWFWTSLRKGRGPALVVDLSLSLAIAALVGLRWLRFLGIPPETVLTFGGVGGLALGLASQTVVGNLVSGLLLLVTQPFAVGDEVCTDDRQGIVRRIGWSRTVLELNDGSRVLIPNRSIVGSKAVNLSVCPTRVVALTLPIQFPNGAAQCEPLLRGVQELVAADSALRRLLCEPPRALLDFDLKLKAPTLTVEATVDGRVTTNDLEELKSGLLVAVATFIEQRGAVMPGFTR